LIKSITRQFHRELGRVRESIHKQFPFNIYATSINRRSEILYAEKRRGVAHIYTTLEYNKKIQQKISPNERVIDAFALGLRYLDLVEELGRIKSRTVSKLMEVANRFTDREDAYHSKRARSPEYDRSSRQNNQRRGTHNDDSRNMRNQVAAGHKISDEEGGEPRNNGYHRKDDLGGDRSIKFDPLPEDIFNGPCRIHYTYHDGKKVSNHLMRDCRTFVKLQEAMELSRAAKPGYTAYGVLPPPYNKRAVNQGYPMHHGLSNPKSKVYISAMIQLVPKSKKEQKSISRQVNLAISSPPATIEYMRWSEQTAGFSRKDHPRKVLRPGHAPMVLKAQIGGYDVAPLDLDLPSG
jgi:hypothetical protein